MNGRMRSIWSAGLGIAMLLAAIGGTAQAGDKKPADDWTFEVSPYFWLASMSGQVGVFERVAPSDIDLTFNQIFNHIQWPAVVMVAGEARHGPFGILADAMYMEVQGEGLTPGPLFGSATLNMKAFTGTLEGAYRVVDSPSVQVDGMVGLRAFSVNMDLDLSSGRLPGRSGSDSQVWVDPLIAARVTVPFGKGFFVRAYGDVGGFGISGGDLTWQFFGSVGYDFTSWLSAYAGFRYLNVQHEDGGFVYDVSQQGPIIGATIKF